MTLTLTDQTLCAKGKPRIIELSPELVLEPDPLFHGAFLAVRAAETGSRHVVDLGSIPDLERYTLCHRYEPYWMMPAAGARLGDVPPETQYLLAKLTDNSWLLLVPLVGDLFRYSLRGRDDRLILIGETGDAHAAGAGGLALYAAVGTDPDALVHGGARSVSYRLGVVLRQRKPLPDFVDTFGWCTWDAFYGDVSAELVERGLASFASGGVSPRFMILDDGWQAVRRMPTGEKRLVSFEPNAKFPDGLRALVDRAKFNYKIERFLVWQTAVGYWGGVDGTSLPNYGVIDQTRHFGDGILHYVPTFNDDWWGALVGFVPPERIATFYDDYHATLAAQGVDGVKVDSQAVLEALGQQLGGRVKVTGAYRQALEASVQKHFAGRLINCMSNAQETWYGSPKSTLIRTSLDFYPNRPETHGSHLYTNAQVGLWFGEFMHPDWDMFQSGHEWGAYHAAGRAVSGGPVYVSDKPGSHDFQLLRKLVCSDGRVLRCDGPGLPTHDTLCFDPTQDNVPLKIRNRCGRAGVVGVFNAHTGADAVRRRPVLGQVGPTDVPGLTESEFAVFAHRSNRVSRVDRQGRLPLSLGYRGFEVYTFAPLEHGFAAIGLADKLNSAGAITSVESAQSVHTVSLCDGGEFVGLSNSPPRSVTVGGQPAPFRHEAATGELRVTVQAPRPGAAARVQIRY